MSKDLTAAVYGRAACTSTQADKRAAARRAKITRAQECARAFAQARYESAVALMRAQSSFAR